MNHESGAEASQQLRPSGLAAAFIAYGNFLFRYRNHSAERLAYATTEEFITHVLEKEMLHFEDAGSDEDIRDRLKGLGYIS